MTDAVSPDDPVPVGALVQFIRQFNHDARNAAFPLQVQLHLIDGSTSAETVEAIREFLSHHRQLLASLDRAMQALRGYACTRRATVELAALLTKSIASLGSEAGRVQLVREGNPLITGDSEALQQVFVEILQNAVEYSGPDRPVEVRIESRDSTAVVSISDQGPGIPADRLESIFVPFRHKPIDLLRGHSGLGLPLARQIVAAHGGDLSIAHSSNAGTEVVAEFPCSKAPAVDPSAASTN